MYKDCWSPGSAMSHTGYRGIGDPDHYLRSPFRSMWREEIEGEIAPQYAFRTSVEQAEFNITDATLSLKLRPWTAVRPASQYNRLSGDPVMLFMSSAEDFTKLYLTLATEQAHG